MTRRITKTPHAPCFSRRFLSLAGRATAPSVLLMVLAACSSSDGAANSDPSGSGGTAGTGGEGGAGGAADDVCPTAESVFDIGDATGHADPYGARAAGEARAGRLTDAAMIVQPAHGRQQVRVGDYVLANDTIAVVIEDVGVSDGYSRFGGEILAVDKVGDNGRPMGLSNYVETLLALSNEVVEATSVTVMNDGSDGSAAIIRATGKLSPVAILSGALGPLFGAKFGLEVALDYVLEPGSAKLDIRLGIINPSEDDLEIAGSQEMHGFFQTNHNQLATLGNGFETPEAPVDWVGFISGDWNFAYRLPAGVPISSLMDVSGFRYYRGEGFTVDGCATTWRDHVEIIGGGPHFDGLIAAVRAVDGDTSATTVTGTVRDADGQPVAGTIIHAEDKDGMYLSRTQTDALGQYSVNLIGKEGDGWQIVAGQQELPTKLTVPAGDEAVVDIDLPANGTIHVSATEKGTDTELPVRIQVVPRARASSHT